MLALRRGTAQQCEQLTFAFLLRIVRRAAYNALSVWDFDLEGDADASSHQTATRNPGLSERVYPAARLRAESGGDWPSLRPLFARDRPQASHQSSRKRVHQTGMEPEPLGRDGAYQDRGSSDRTAAARLRCGGSPH